MNLHFKILLYKKKQNFHLKILLGKKRQNLHLKLLKSNFDRIVPFLIYLIYLSINIAI